MGWINQTTPHLHSDETPTPVKGSKEWLWVLAGEGFCLFHAGDTRGREGLEKCLGSSYQGVLISDDFSVYNGYPVAGQQKCLAHLRRHFQRLFKTKGLYNEQIAETFISLIDEASRATPIVAATSRWDFLPTLGPRIFRESQSRN